MNDNDALDDIVGEPIAIDENTGDDPLVQLKPFDECLQDG